eukprot:419503-Amphidinium_carterae.1
MHFARNTLQVSMLRSKPNGTGKPGTNSLNTFLVRSFYGAPFWILGSAQAALVVPVEVWSCELLPAYSSRKGALCKQFCPCD